MDKPPIDAAALAEIEAQHNAIDATATTGGITVKLCWSCSRYMEKAVLHPCLPSQLAFSLRLAWAEIEELKILKLRLQEECMSLRRRDGAIYVGEKPR